MAEQNERPSRLGAHRLILLAAVATLAAAALPGRGVAQSRPTYAEQQTACMGDAFRLCLSAIPDKSAIEACMARQHDKLSPRCRAVFDASASAEAGTPYP